MKRILSWGDLLNILISALLYAISFEIFIFPNEFAPAGIPGLETMIQQKWGFPMSTMRQEVIYPAPEGEHLPPGFPGKEELLSKTRL